MVDGFPRRGCKLPQRMKHGHTSLVRNWRSGLGVDGGMTTMRLPLGVLVIAVLVVGCPEERIVAQ